MSETFYMHTPTGQMWNLNPQPYKCTATVLSTKLSFPQKKNNNNISQRLLHQIIMTYFMLSLLYKLNMSQKRHTVPNQSQYRILRDTSSC